MRKMYDDKKAEKRINLSGIAFVCFIAVLIFVEVGAGNIDLTLNSLISKMHSSFLDGPLYVLTHLFDAFIFIVLCVLVSALLFWKKRKEELALFVLCISSGVVISEVIKLLVQRARSSAYLITETGFSFPSSHAVAVTLFTLFIIFLCENNIKNIKFNKAIYVLGWILIILVSFSRVYFSVHWTSDVVGGVLFGVAWFNLVIGVYEKFF